MAFPKKSILFFCLAIPLTLLLFYVNYNSSSLIENIYQQSQFDFLNALAKVEGKHSLGYYIGKIDDASLGPLTNMFSFAILVVFSFLYLQQSSTRIFALSIFFFLVISKFNVLFYPIYGDAIGGPFAEGWWLATNNFDYKGLAAQAGYNEGGPRVYFLSLYPAGMAMMIKLISHPKTFLVVNHLLVFFMSSVIVALVRSLLQKSLSSKSSILASIVVLALPLYQSQTEAINMEIPCLFVSMYAIYALCHKRLGLASALSILAMLVKGLGVIIGASVAFVCLYLFIFDKDLKHKMSLFVWASIPVVFVLLKVLLIPSALGNLIGLFYGWPSFLSMTIPKVYLFCVILLLMYWIGQAGGLKSFFISLSDKYYIQFVIFLVMTMWFGLFLNFTAVSPRYKTELVPFMVMSLVFAFLNFRFIYKFSSYILIVVILTSALASYGLFFHKLQANYHVLMERSLEYRNDLKLNVQMVNVLKEKYPSFTIGAPFLTAQMLTIPQLGYVDKKFDVVLYGMPITYGPIKPFRGVNEMNIRNTIWVGLPAQQKSYGAFEYPISSHDKVVEKLQLGENRVNLFVGGFAIEHMRLLMREIQKNKG